MAVILGGTEVPRIRRVYPPTPTPPRIPQRVITAGTPGPAMSSFLERLAVTLDVPLVPLADLPDPSDATELAAFDGWVTTSEYDAARTLLVDRADLVVHLSHDEPGTLRGLVRRTVRRMRADGAEPDLTWLASLTEARPEVAFLHLAGPTAAEAWLVALSG